MILHSRRTFATALLSLLLFVEPAWAWTTLRPHLRSNIISSKNNNRAANQHALLSPTSSTGFHKQQSSIGRTVLPSTIPSSTSLQALPFLDTPTILFLADETASSSSSSWRQYVPLVVSSFVLLDIVMGSPAANSVTRLMQKRVDENQQQEGGGGGNGTSLKTKPNNTSSSSSSATAAAKPRIDVDAVVKQALDKAENVQSLRNYLDSRKSDWDRMEDIRREQDKLMEQLDDKNRM